MLVIVYSFFRLLSDAMLQSLALIVLVIFLLLHFRRQRLDREKKTSELRWFADLHLFGGALAQCPHPKQMADLTLRRTTEMFGGVNSYLFIQTSGSDAISHFQAQGLSTRTVQGLSSDPLRSYVARCGERWGNLLVVPDLSQGSLEVTWQRDTIFHEFRTVFVKEGLKNLLVVGLQVRESSYGVLLMGSREPRAFRPNELRLALAMGNQLGVAVENWSLHRAAERHNRELKMLHRVSEQLRTTFDLESQVEILRRELEGVLETTNFALALQDSPEGLLKTVVPFKIAAFMAPPETVGFDDLAVFVSQNRRPLLLIENLQNTARRLGIKSVDARLRTWCGVPIHFSDGTTGVLAAGDFERENVINQEQFELLQVLADEAASAIENARLFQRERRRSSQLALLNKLAQKAASVLDPNELLCSICGDIRSAFDREFARIEVVDGQAKELVVEAESGYGENLLGRRVRYGEGLSGLAATTQEPVLSNSVLDDPRYLPLRPNVRSSLSLPLMNHDELLGVLSLESLWEHSFSQQDVLTLQSLADQLGIAFHNARAYQLALEQAITDGLTSLKTHRYFREALSREWSRSVRSGRPFSVIMMDLDGFKQVNDHGGHLEGDKVLAAVAGLLETRSRQSNVVARYGGDEFTILMPETDTEQAETLAERLRSSVETDPFLRARGVTVSIGIGTFPDHGSTPEEILRVADAGMYLAKYFKGNCVKVASLAIPAGDGELVQQLLDAFLEVEVKRRFSSGPDTFSDYEQKLQHMKPLWDTITSLALTIEAKDPYMKGHFQKVSNLAVQIAAQAGLSPIETEELHMACIVHDIGKIHVPDHVYFKPALLTPDEYELVKSHPAWGAKVLEPLKIKTIERMVRHHHESFNGEGYPDNLKGEQIPLGARIICVADAYDAMVSDRAYRKGRSIKEAVAELQRCRGTQFDPFVLDVFLASLKEPTKQPRSDSVDALVPLGRHA